MLNVAGDVICNLITFKFKKLFLLSWLMPMVKIYPAIFFVCITATGVQAQGIPAKKDTIKQLQPVTVKAYLSEQPVLGVPASIGVINQQQLSLQPDNSFIPVLNTMPGVRAEERSPGSYR